MGDKIYDLESWIITKRFIKTVGHGLWQSDKVHGPYECCRNKMDKVEETVLTKLDKLIALVQQSIEMGT